MASARHPSPYQINTRVWLTAFSRALGRRGLLAAGHSIKAVSLRLGHATIEITLSVDSHVLPTDDATRAEGPHRLYGRDWLQLGYSSGP